MSYAFVDMKCPRCNDNGVIPCEDYASVQTCPKCHGTGIVGDFAKVPDIELPRQTELGIVLRKTRQQRKLTLRELAQKFECTVSRLSNIETGRVVPTPEEIRMIEEWINGE